jgi:hypothetical protein
MNSVNSPVPAPAAEGLRCPSCQQQPAIVENVIRAGMTARSTCVLIMRCPVCANCWTTEAPPGGTTA